MMIQVIARRGGIGTSALAFCIASAEDHDSLLLDYSKHPGGARWVSGAGEINTSWPTFFGNQWTDNLSLQFERLMYACGNVGLFSGGAHPPKNIVIQWLKTQSQKLIVIDGEFDQDVHEFITIHHSTNSLQEWNEFGGDTSTCHVVQLRLGGLPRKFFTDDLGLSNVHFYAHQKSVRTSLELGMGVHRASRVFKAAKEVLEHVKHR